MLTEARSETEGSWIERMILRKRPHTKEKKTTTISESNPVVVQTHQGGLASTEALGLCSSIPFTYVYAFCIFVCFILQFSKQAVFSPLLRDIHSRILYFVYIEYMHLINQPFSGFTKLENPPTWVVCTFITLRHTHKLIYKSIIHTQKNKIK